jgi:hypothetical protein
MVPKTTLNGGTTGNVLIKSSDNNLDFGWQVLSGGGNALTGSPLSQFASTTSAQLAGVLSNETGTGSIVLSESPALTGTPTVPTATAYTNTTQAASTEFVMTGGPVQVLALSGNATANATTSMVEITGLNKTIAAGTYHFKYIIRAQSSALTTSLKFAVNHTGTTSVFFYRLEFPSGGVTAATGAVDQENNVTTGAVVAHHSTRVKNTTLGPQTDVDVTNADILFIVEGMFISSTSGDLELYHGSETATSTQVMAGTSLILTKLL